MAKKREQMGKQELEAGLRELREELERLKREGGAEPWGVAERILEGLAGVILGLEELLQTFEQSDALRQRLEAVDAEVESRLKERLTNLGGGRRSPRPGPVPMGIPPSVRRPVARRAAARPARWQTPAPVEEPPADIFDEGNELRVVAELPGINAKDIKADLNGAQLVIWADTPTHKYRKEMTLPCAPRAEIGRRYRNGVVEITFARE